MQKIIPKNFLAYKLRLEYGENKIVVCHISKDNNMLFKKASICSTELF